MGSSFAYDAVKQAAKGVVLFFQRLLRRSTSKNLLTALIIWVAILALGSTSFGLAGRNRPDVNGTRAVQPAGVADPNIAAVKTACQLIYDGKFDAAGEVIDAYLSEEQGGSADKYMRQLASVVEQRQQIEQQRQQLRKQLYQEQLEKLEKLARGESIDEADEAIDPETITDSNDMIDAADANEIRQITTKLSVIAKARMYADPAQRTRLLLRPFVRQTFAEAVAKASDFEAEGQWLEAYLVCYSWLKEIDPDNQVYSDYAEDLLIKANIVAASQDSPCETRKERYQGIDLEMFTRAIDFLNYNYVNPIDYTAMMRKAIDRCKMFAEVLGASADVRQAYEVQEDPDYGQKLIAFSSGLDGLLDELEEAGFGISKDKFIGIFTKVMMLNDATVALPEPVFIAQFAEASLESLDPHTILIWPKQMADFEKSLTNEFTGIGIEISKRQGRLTVGSLLPDTPAYNSGLDAGDIIAKVDGIATKDMSLVCAVKNITGPAGTGVTLTIKRPGNEELFDITITRARITVPSLRGWQRITSGDWKYFVDQQSKIGYVRLTSFDERSSDDLEKIIDQLEEEGMKGLILDLRFNSGGLLTSAIAVTDKFIGDGLIVSSRPRPGAGRVSYAAASKFGTHSDLPLVILVNKYSASASEIVAGALTDPMHERAILVGHRTHGKGSVQNVNGHPGGGAQLKYTMAYYHLPSGQRVKSRDEQKELGKEDWGVAPDIEVVINESDLLISEEFEKMRDIQRDNDVLFKAGHESSGNDSELVKHSLQEMLDADPQLAVAILAARAQLIERQAAAD